MTIKSSHTRSHQTDWLHVGVLLALGLLWPTAKADDIQSCIDRPVSFDDKVSLTYAIVQGAPRTERYLHGEYPHGCISDEQGGCKGPSYLIPGDQVAVAKTCGAWSFVQYVGKRRTSLGWIQSDQLVASTRPPTAKSAAHNLPLQSGQPAFSFELLGVPKGTFLQGVTGINDEGDVVGVVDLEDGDTRTARTVIWRRGSTAMISMSQEAFYPAAISNAGEVAGNPGSQAGIQRNSMITNLPDLHGYGSSVATGIDSKGQAIGWSNSATGRTAILWENGWPLDLGAMIDRAGNSEAHAINNAGQIVGRFFNDELPESYAILWSGGRATFLTPVGGADSSADGINDRGQVVGWRTIGPSGEGPYYSDADAILWEYGKTVDLGRLEPFSRTSARAINNAGQIVGSAYDPWAPHTGNSPSENHALYWSQNREMIDLNNLLPPAVAEAGWLLQEAIAINANGTIVGKAYNLQTGETRPFLMKPTLPGKALP